MARLDKNSDTYRAQMRDAADARHDRDQADNVNYGRTELNTGDFPTRGPIVREAR